MKSSLSPQKTLHRTTNDVTQRASAGPDGIAVVPPQHRTQGTDIPIAAGQERRPEPIKGRFLPREAWHVMQQKREKTKPVMLRDQAQNPDLQTIITPATREQPGVAQRFINDLLVTSQLAGSTLPAGSMYSFINAKVTALVNLCNQYGPYEDGPLDFAQYLPDAQQSSVYQKARPYLSAIYGAAESVLPMLDDTVYDRIRPFVTRIRDCAWSDYIHYSTLAGVAAMNADAAFNRIFKLGINANPYAVYPEDYITSANFLIAKNAGLLQLQMVKWWRSPQFQGFNAEINVFIGGNFWAIAHLKWNPGHPPAAKEDPFMYNFKTPNNESFPGQYSLITNDSVKVYLLGACMNYIQTTAQPWKQNEYNRAP